jgi:GNAT superfamily N-acetyltransferase
MSMDGPTDAPVHFRRLWLAERDLYLSHLRRLDPEGRRTRFGAYVTNDALRRFVDDAASSHAIVHAAVVGETARGISEVRSVPGAWPSTAEVAISVEAPFRGLGFGRGLMGRAVTTARNRGLHRLVLVCSVSNTAMRRLAAEFGADAAPDGVPAGDLEGVISPTAPSVLSFMSEWLDDAFSLNRYILNL